MSRKEFARGRTSNQAKKDAKETSPTFIVVKATVASRRRPRSKYPPEEETLGAQKVGGVLT